MAEVMIDSIRDGRVWLLDQNSIAVADNYYIGFSTVNQFARIVASTLNATGKDVEMILFRDSSYTGGTASTLYNRNQRITAAGFFPPADAFIGVTPDNVLDPDGALVINKTVNRVTAQSPSSFNSNTESNILLLQRNDDFIIQLSVLGGGMATVDLSFTIEAEQSITV